MKPSASSTVDLKVNFSRYTTATSPHSPQLTAAVVDTRRRRILRSLIGCLLVVLLIISKELCHTNFNKILILKFLKCHQVEWNIKMKRKKKKKKEEN